MIGSLCAYEIYFRVHAIFVIYNSLIGYKLLETRHRRCKMLIQIINLVDRCPIPAKQICCAMNPFLCFQTRIGREYLEYLDSKGAACLTIMLYSCLRWSRRSFRHQDRTDWLTSYISHICHIYVIYIIYVIYVIYMS